MYIFVLLFLNTLFLSIVVKALPKDNEQKTLFMCVMFVALVYVHSMINVTTVPDLPEYQDCYNWVEKTSWLDCLTSSRELFDAEAGYILFNKLISLLSGNFNFFLFIYSVVLIGLYYKTINRYSPSVYLSVICMIATIYCQSIFVLRQHMAMAIFFASYPLMLERKTITFFLTTLLAISFHMTAIICVIPFLLYNIQNRNSKYLILFAIVGLYFFFSRVVDIYAGLLLEYSSYIETDDVTSWRNAVPTSLTFVTYVLVLKKKVFDDGINKLVLILLALSLVMLLLGIGYNPVGRLVLYYSSAVIIAIPIILKEINKLPVKLSIALLLLTVWCYPTYRQIITHFKFFELL